MYVRTMPIDFSCANWRNQQSKFHPK